MCDKIWVQIKMLGKTFGVWVDPEATVEEVCRSIVPDDWGQIYRVVDRFGRPINLHEKIGMYNEIEIYP